MNKKTERLIEKCKLFEPLDGRVLLYPLKVRTYKAKDVVPITDGMTEEEVRMGEKEVELKTVERDVMYRYQRAVVLQIPNDEIRFVPGDTIVYNVGALHNFDLINDVSLLKKYDIIAVENVA